MDEIKDEHSRSKSLSRKHMKFSMLWIAASRSSINFGYLAHLNLASEGQVSDVVVYYLERPKFASSSFTVECMDVRIALIWRESPRQ